MMPHRCWRRWASSGWLSATLVLTAAVLGIATAGAQGADCPEPNDDLGSACTIASPAVVQAFIERPGDIDMYRFVAGGGGDQVSLELADLPADYDLYLMDANGGILGQSVHEGTAPEELRLTVQPGTYYAVVQADPSREIDAARPYILSITVSGNSRTVTAPVSDSGSRRILLAENFDDPRQGILPSGPVEGGDVERAYLDGEYSIRNTDSANRARGVPIPGRYDDMTMVVDVRLVGATTGRAIFLECRKQAGPDPHVASSYVLGVFPGSSEFGIFRLDQGRSTPIVRRQVSPHLLRGDATNRLELSCVGGTITARSNGQDLGSVEDTAYGFGASNITIIGPTNEMPHAEARLDNLVVFGP